MAPRIDPDDSNTRATTIGHLQERFEVRAQALVYARLAPMGVALLALAVPAWRSALNIPLPAAVYGYLALVVAHLLSVVWVGRRWAHAVIFSTLCLDLGALIYAAVLSGGIKSPLMPAHLVFTMLFALLFPSPVAIVPPLLTLPIVAWFDQVFGVPRLPADVLLLVWYAALNITVVYIVVYLEGRERVALAEVLRLQGERRDQALVSQRTSIARDMHDGVGAALSGILLQAEYLVPRIVDQEIKEEVEELREAASEGMEELRRAVSILRREFQLGTAVSSYANAFASRHHLSVSSSVSGTELELDAESGLTLVRVLQEALANVARHAKAEKVEVALRFLADKVELLIEDDGCGFEPERSVAGHYGLRNMSERVRKVGGELRVSSAPNRGARIEVNIPRLPPVG